MNPLFTIGHSDIQTPRFVHTLKEHNIAVAVDVRSSPYSRRNPQFSREALRHALRETGIQYLFLGRELGARREEPDCYQDGQAKYELIEHADAFQEGLRRLRQGIAQFQVALVCAEEDPITCHRMVLVCKCLRNTVHDIRHVRRGGTYETNEEAEKRMLNAVGLNTGFATPSVIEQAYRLQGLKIAYVDDPSAVGWRELASSPSQELKLF